MKLKEFIIEIGTYAQQYYKQYQILPSLCIAQFLLESNKSDYKKELLTLSGLATDCHNYAGMKWTSTCGTEYKEYKTGEQKKDGTYYSIMAKFRKYTNRAAGVKGYFDFLQYARYQCLKGVTDYKKACNLIREAGWATSLTYTQNLIARIEYLGLDQFDNMSFDPKSYKLPSEQQPELKAATTNPHKEPTVNTCKGSSGSVVKWIQYELNQKGYNVTIDGVFGIKTLEAIKAFQADSNLKVDGIVGAKTRQALKS